VADRGEAKHPGSAFWQGDRVAADQRQAVAFARSLDSAQEIDLPFSRASDGQREERTCWRRALRGEIGQIDRDELPPDAGGGIGAEEMHAFRDRIVGDDHFAEDCDVVEESASGG